MIKHGIGLAIGTATCCCILKIAKSRAAVGSGGCHSHPVHRRSCCSRGTTTMPSPPIIMLSFPLLPRHVPVGSSTSAPNSMHYGYYEQPHRCQKSGCQNLDANNIRSSSRNAANNINNMFYLSGDCDDDDEGVYSLPSAGESFFIRAHNHYRENITTSSGMLSVLLSHKTKDLARSTLKAAFHSFNGFDIFNISINSVIKRAVSVGAAEKDETSEKDDNNADSTESVSKSFMYQKHLVEVKQSCVYALLVM